MVMAMKTPLKNLAGDTGPLHHLSCIGTAERCCLAEVSRKALESSWGQDGGVRRALEPVTSPHR